MHDVFIQIAVIAAILLASFSVPATGHAQEPSKPTAPPTEANPATPAPGHSLHGEAFNDGPRRLAYPMAGQGKIHFPVTTAKPEAQTYIDQGVAQLHSFYYFESERSFRQAAKLDPDCAMAYWGMAMSNVNNAKRAKAFLKEAQKRAGKLSRHEQLYLDALEGFYREAGNDKDRRKNLLLGLETIVQEFPNDIDARAWLAMVTWQNSTHDGIGSRQAVDFLIQSVLDREAMHPGAHHYRIHLWDNVKPERAERAAALYAASAPGIAHAWHMPGHTYTGLKRYADAVYQQEGSARVDHAYMYRDRVMPFEIHNYAHNNQWLCTSDSHIGRVREAIAMAKNLVEQPRDPQRNNVSDGGSAQRSGRLRWSEVLTRYELWDELVADTTSGAIDWSDIPLEKLQKAYSLGQAYAAKKDATGLKQQIDAIKALKVDEAKPVLAELLGYELLAKGDIGPAFEQFGKATTMRPETLARAHLSARNYGFAESVAKKAVEQNAEQVPPLAALVEVLLAAGKENEAKETYLKLRTLASTADRDLPVFRRLEPLAKKLEAEGKLSAQPDALTGTEEAAVRRVDLKNLGPLYWTPFPAEPLAGTDTEGKSWNLDETRQRGKSVLVLYFLGGKCAHCMQQLELFGKEFENLRNLNVETIAVSTDDAETTRALKHNAEKIKFPMPMLADPKLEHFKRYRTFDDFENQPLHGTFLIDSQGNIRYQRISADPFLDVDFIKTEAARINRLLKRS